MKLIVGLGNPEPRYNGTRHNIGFASVFRFATSTGSTFKEQSKFKALVAELNSGNGKSLVVMPTTYYNLSGESVRALMDFYKVSAQDVLIIHDELALPVGTIRTRYGGSDAGNNGVKSITQHVGENTARIRVGIWNEQRDQMGDADFVLSKFNADERATLDSLQHVVDGCIEDFLYDKLETTTHR